MSSAGALSLPAAASTPGPGAAVAVDPTAGPTARRKIDRRGPGRLLPHRLGRYELFDHIGRGGMADIYRARMDTALGGSRQVVIKEVLPELADNARFAELLIDEAKLASRLSHQSIVQVEDLGRHDGVLYIAMEYVEGLDLRELLRRCARAKIPLPVDLSLRIVSDVLRALDVAHRAKIADGAVGIVHRDVSPSNVLLSFDGEVKLCDFGIARAADAPHCPEAAVEGKAGYMAPEHARGELVDARSDVFAAGILLWEMLAGRRLYRESEGTSLLEVACAAVIPPLPSRDLPCEADLHAIVARALEVDRDRRWPTAAAMLEALEEWLHRSGYFASHLKLGAFLTDHFGAEITAARRARERAVEALRRGPPAIIVPIRALGPAAAEAAMEALTARRPAPTIRDVETSREPASMSTSDPPPPRHTPPEPPPSLAGTATDLDAPPREPKPTTSPWTIAFVALVVAVVLVLALLRA